MASAVAAAGLAAPVVAASKVTCQRTRSFQGLRAAPFATKQNDFAARTTSNSGRVQCMKVWTPVDNIKYETLSYLPPLTKAQIAKQVDYLLENNWIPCIEFDANNNGAIFREHVTLEPGYYDGRYWTLWKLPLFGCKDPEQVLSEIEEAKKTFPASFIRVIGFDNIRQTQCISFIVHKP